MEYSAQRQSGSVIVYAIVGVLLAAAAVGAIIVAQNRGSQQGASRPLTEAPQTQNQGDDDKSKSTDQAAKDQAAKEKTAADQQAAKEKAQAEAKKQAEEKLAADKKAAEEKVTADQQAAAAGPMARAGADQSASLPTTGPADDMLSMLIGIVAITGAGYFYYHFGRRS